MKHFLILLALLPILGLRPLRAETTACTAITSAPYTITTPGIYCLKQNLNVNNPPFLQGGTIDVDASNVVLDLNGFKLENTSDLDFGSVGIGIRAGRHNIVIRNGTIRDFHSGISTGSSSNNILIEEMLVTGNFAIASGILVGGARTTIRNNRIVNTGGPGGDRCGIFLDGYGHRIANNEIGGVSNDLEFCGIWLQSDDTLVEGNRVVNVYVGIEVLGEGALLHGNRIQRATQGIYFVPASSGKYRGTLTFDVTTPYTGGTDAGGNH